MKITQLTTNGVSKSPDISEDSIVWIENRNSVVLLDDDITILPDLEVNLKANPQISEDGVLWQGYTNRWQNFYYDGAETTQLTEQYSVDDEKLDGNNIAWRSTPEYTPLGELFEVYLYDGSTQTTSQLTDDNNRETSVDISGENVVWSSAGNSIWLDDGDTTTELAQGGVNPHVSGDRVAWEAYSGGQKNDIYLYEDGVTVQIVDSDHSVAIEGFFDGNLVWREWDGNDWELYRHDGTTTFQVTDNDFNDRVTGNSTATSVTSYSNTAVDGSGDNLVWSSSVDGKWEVFFYDGTETIQVSDNDFRNVQPKISGNKLVWSALEGNNSDIFLYEAESDASGLLLTEDFEPDLDDSQWSSFGSDDVNNNFGGDGQSLFFTGGESNDSSRQITTVGLNVASGGNIYFDLIFGDDSNGGQKVDLGEDVALEFSLNNGASWREIAVYDPQEFTDWTDISEVIPSSAQTESTQFRWSQEAHSGSRFDLWGLDNISIVEPELDAL